MQDLFNGHSYLESTHEPKLKDDLFGGQIPVEEPFHWVCAIFRSNGAQIAIRSAISAQLDTFYPYRILANGETKPYWSNYLFIEYRKELTVQICRMTTKFIRMINKEEQWLDDDGNEQIRRVPILLRYNDISDVIDLFKRGTFNFQIPIRKHYPKGTMTRIIGEENFSKYDVELMNDVTSDTPPNKKVQVKINGYSAIIEARKLALI